MEVLRWAREHGCPWNEDTVVPLLHATGTWRCCGGRGSTTARGMAVPYMGPTKADVRRQSNTCRLKGARRDTRTRATAKRRRRAPMAASSLSGMSSCAAFDTPSWLRHQKRSTIMRRQPGSIDFHRTVSKNNLYQQSVAMCRLPRAARVKWNMVIVHFNVPCTGAGPTPTVTFFESHCLVRLQRRLCLSDRGALPWPPRPRLSLHCGCYRHTLPLRSRFILFMHLVQYRVYSFACNAACCAASGAKCTGARHVIHHIHSVPVLALSSTTYIVYQYPPRHLPNSWCTGARHVGGEE